jgi:hypothetical protein
LPWSTAGGGQNRRHQPARPRLINERLVLPPPAIDTANIRVSCRYGRGGFEIGRRAVKFILGVICGAALMLGSAYLHDAGMVRVGPSQPLVNWDALIGMLGR